MEDTKFQCTQCGQISSVGRCCGRDTRMPLNDAALAESNQERRKGNMNVPKAAVEDLMRLEYNDAKSAYRQGDWAHFADHVTAWRTYSLILARFGGVQIKDPFQSAWRYSTNLVELDAEFPGLLEEVLNDD